MKICQHQRNQHKIWIPSTWTSLSFSSVLLSFNSWNLSIRSSYELLLKVLGYGFRFRIPIRLRIALKNPFHALPIQLLFFARRGAFGSTVVGSEMNGELALLSCQAVISLIHGYFLTIASLSEWIYHRYCFPYSIYLYRIPFFNECCALLLRWEEITNS